MSINAVLIFYLKYYYFFFKNNTRNSYQRPYIFTFEKKSKIEHVSMCMIIEFNFRFLYDIFCLFGIFLTI